MSITTYQNAFASGQLSTKSLHELKIASPHLSEEVITQECKDIAASMAYELLNHSDKELNNIIEFADLITSYVQSRNADLDQKSPTFKKAWTTIINEFSQQFISRTDSLELFNNAHVQLVDQQVLEGIDVLCKEQDSPLLMMEQEEYQGHTHTM